VFDLELGLEADRDHPPARMVKIQNSCYNRNAMKFHSSSRAAVLTAEKKVAAKAASVSSVLSSFAIEGVRFTPKQVESIKRKSGINFSK